MHILFGADRDDTYDIMTSYAICGWGTSVLSEKNSQPSVSIHQTASVYSNFL